MNETTPILTLGQLRAATAGLDDDVQIVVATDDWYDNVASVEVPTYDNDGDLAGDYAAVTIFPGEPVDSRQF